jgi:hypothetical protein
LAELEERGIRLILGYRPSSCEEFLLASIHPPPLWSPSPVLQDDRADTLDLHAGGIPKLDGASDIGVKLSEELPSTGHVIGAAGVEAPPATLIVARAIAEEGVRSRLIKVEESRCGRCR